GHRGQYPETFLIPDAQFYAEHATKCIDGVPNQPPGCWVINNTDGQDRLFGFDFDDRGYVYVAYNPYGWGILKDSQGALLQSVFQQNTDTPGILTPNRVISVKTGSGYFLIVSPDNGIVSNVFYVGDANTVAHDRRSDIRHVI